MGVRACWNRLEDALGMLGVVALVAFVITDISSNRESANGHDVGVVGVDALAMLLAALSAVCVPLVAWVRRVLGVDRARYLVRADAGEDRVFPLDWVGALGFDLSIAASGWVFALGSLLMATAAGVGVELADDAIAPSAVAVVTWVSLFILIQAGVLRLRRA